MHEPLRSLAVPAREDVLWKGLKLKWASEVRSFVGKIAIGGGVRDED